MANIISGQIISIGQTQTITPKSGQGNTLIKREFVIRALRFNPDDGTPELSEFNTPSLEINGEDKVGVLDGLKVGDVVKVAFSVEGRSYEDQNHNVKYFNSVRANRVEKINVTLPQVQTQTQQNVQSTQKAAAQAPQQQQGVQGAQGQQAAAPQNQGGVDANGNPLPF